MHFVSQLKQLNRTATCLLFMLSIAMLQACSGGSGSDPTDRASDTSDSGTDTFIYSGPAPGNQEIQNFKLGFYDNVVNRCGSCHTSGTNVAHPFVDKNDINVAYRAALPFANLDNASASIFVDRMVDGHNCWIPDGNASCAVNMTNYIQRWIDGPAQSMTSITLSPRDPQPISNVLVPPATYNERPVPADIVATDLDVTLTDSVELMGLVRTYCSRCHSSSAAASDRQSPYFADSNDEVSYQALITKIDVNTPENSRLVVRLRNDHNCWDAENCESNAQTMQLAVENFADSIERFFADLDPPPPALSLVLSAGQHLEDGIVASGGGRFETDLIAKWEFQEGDGNSVADTSLLQPEIPLTIQGQFEWVGGWGVNLDGAVIQGAVNLTRDKLHQRIVGAGEYTIEAWVAPNNVVQEDAWIFGYAGGENSRNVLLAQTMYSYDFYNRSSTNPLAYDGAPIAFTPGELAQATLQHVVVTYDPANGRKIYVNGQDSGVTGVDTQATLVDWSQSYIISIGDDPTRNNPWQGVIKMIAVHSRALNQEQIAQNYDVGVGQKYFVMFSISDHLDQDVCRLIENPGTPEEVITDYCYIVFEVSQFDSYGYLFKDPRFVNINPDAANTELDFNIRGIYIGINGQLAGAGQGFVNVNARISGNGDEFTMEGDPLLQRGAIVPLQNGPDNDVFYLAFREINDNEDVSIEAEAGNPDNFNYALAYGYNSSSQSVQIGMRTFDEINETYSHITGVPKTSVSSTYAAVRRSLPQIGDFQAYMASHQMAVMQLAAAYCEVLVSQATYRNALFRDNSDTVFNFDAQAHNVSDIEWEDQIIVPLMERSYATGIDSQPSRAYDAADSVHAVPPSTLTYDPDGKADRVDIVDELLDLINNTDDNSAAENPIYRDNKRDGLKYCETYPDPCPDPVAKTREVVKAVCTAVLSSAAVTIK